jgi:hypothetical protein
LSANCGPTPATGPTFNADFSLTGVAVPGPIVGAGLPDLILMVVAFSLGGDEGRRLPDLDFIAFE